MALSSIEEENNFNKGVQGLYDVFASEQALKISKIIRLSKNLEEARMFLQEFFNSWSKENISAVKLDIDPRVLKEILTTEEYDKENNCSYRVFRYSLDEIRILDLSDFDFTGLVVDGIDFSPLTGVKIDPQAVNCGSLQCCNFSGVTFTGTFDYTQINGSNFTGSKGAVIDLNKMLDLRGIYGHKTILTDAKILKDNNNAYKLNGDSIITYGAEIVDSYTSNMQDNTYNHQDVLNELYKYLQECTDDSKKLTRNK